jgi:heme exporter protein C
MLKLAWWKLLAIALYLYVILIGFLTPLRPTGFSITPISAEGGQRVQLSVDGYNTHYAHTTLTKAWLSTEDGKYALCATEVKPQTDTKLHLTFDLPHTIIPNKKASLLTLNIDNEIDGSSALPDAFSLVQKTDTTASTTTNSTCTPTKGSLHYAAEGFSFPFRNILLETIRNLFFHVSLWFAMMLLLMGSVYHSFVHLRTGSLTSDYRALSLARTGTLFGILGLITGAIWARYTWGAWWSFDVKQNTSAVCVLIYLAYFILRDSLDDYRRRGRIGAVYNIFAFMAMFPLLFVIPRMTASLHPGNGGNPGLGASDLDSHLRIVFYPAVIATTLFGVWMSNLWYRFDIVHHRHLEHTSNEIN